MSEAFLHADPVWIAAQRRKNRDRRCPIETPRQLTGHLPDPRTVPFTVPRRRAFCFVTALQFFVCAGVVACFWIALS